MGQPKGPDCIADEDALMCLKRAYASAHEARCAHRRASWRVKVYRCLQCKMFHVANKEKE